MIESKGRYFWLYFLLFLITAAFSNAQEQENLGRVINALDKIHYENRYLLTDFGGFGSSILVREARQTESPVTFVLAVPLNADFAVTTALSMVKKLQAYNNHSENIPNILVAFLGDEENKLGKDMGGNSHKGLRDLLTLADMPENWVLCYIDINEAPEKLVIRHGISGYVAPLDIVRPLPGVFNFYNIPWNFRIRHNEIYKLSLVEGPEALFIAWESEINGFVLSGASRQQENRSKFISARFPSPSGSVSAEIIADSLLDYAVILSNTVISGDRYYSYFIFPGGKVFFLSDGLTAALLLIVLGFVLFFFLFNTARFQVILIFNIKLFFRFSWFFIILLPLMVISFKISGSVYSLLLGLLNSRLNTVSNMGAGLSLILAILFFFLPSPVLDYIRFPKRSQFYGVSAVVFVAMGLFASAFLDFSYVPIFLWVFIFAFISSLVKNPVLVFLCIFLIPVFAVDTVVNIIEAGSNRIPELFITSGWRAVDAWIATIITALFSLPLILLIRRGSIIIAKPKQPGQTQLPSRKYRLILIPVLIVAVLAIMTLHILFLPKNPAPERRFYPVQDEKLLKLNLDNILFQDSRIITLHIEAGEKPIRFDVSIESRSAGSLLPVYSAPVPFVREEGGKKVSFSLGENPTNPLVMEIVVPPDFKGILSATAVYNTWHPALDPDKAPETDDYILALTKSIDLEIY